MIRNVYDDPEFFAAYAQLDRSRNGLAGAPEWPAVRALLPDLGGARVLDLGCGYGWFCRWANQHGATRVVGLDLSERMLARAAELTSSTTITYQQADLTTADFGDQAFDVVYSSLALHYIEALDALMARIAAALRPGGRLVFTTEHPIFSARAPGWSTNDDGDRVWAIRRYLVEGSRVTDWLAPGVVKFHRTLGTWVATLLRAGLVLDHLEEWQPASSQLAEDPDLVHELDRPMFVLFAAHRP